MKKLVSILLFICLALPSVVVAKGDDDKKAKKEVAKDVYVLGVSMAFPDSVVYFTEIQCIEDVVLENDFLPGRHMYSYELKDYMSYAKGMPGRTSFIFFSEKRAKLEKKEQKIKKRLIEREGKTVRYLGDSFKFTKH